MGPYGSEEGKGSEGSAEGPGPPQRVSLSTGIGSRWHVHLSDL